MEIKREHDALSKERKELKALLGSKDKQWAQIAGEIKALKAELGQKTALGKRRTSFAEAPEGVELAEAMIEKEPVTIVLSEKGRIRAIRGHQTETDSLAFKEGDRLKRAVKAQTTDTMLYSPPMAASMRSAPTSCPGQGHGEPFRLMIDIEEAADAVELFVHEPGRKLLVAGTSGHGFIVAEDVLAMTRKGKQVLNVPRAKRRRCCAPVDGDSVAVIGDNRKLLLFPSPSCRRCRAARACGFSATRTAASPTPKCSARRRPDLYRRHGPLFSSLPSCAIGGRARRPDAQGPQSSGLSSDPWVY